MLRRFTDDDIDNLVELDSDPEVMRFISGGRPTSREEIENDVLPTFLEYYERFAGYGFWAAVEKSTGRFLGWFHLRPAKGTPADEVELGYRLRLHSVSLNVPPRRVGASRCGLCARSFSLRR